MLSFFSLNTRGLKNNVKRKATFLFCKEQKSHIIFLQETHSTEADTKFWKNQWGDNIFFSHGTSHSAGVMILFNRFSGNVINHLSDINGHWLIMAIEFNDVHYILVCVYGYNTRSQNKQLYSSLIKILESWKVTHATDKVITGGDFNLVPDLWMDRLPPRGQSYLYEEIINEFVTKGNLIDLWRMRNPHTHQYTWFNPANNSQCSRLDFWLISTNLINQALNCDISVSPLTDHCAVLISFQLGGAKPIPNSSWKFNSNLLDSKDFCCKTKSLLHEINQLEMSPLSKWEWFKFKIKETAIEMSKCISSAKKQKQKGIINDLNRLCQKLDLSLEEQSELTNLQNQLDSLYIEKARGAFIRSRARWLEEGEKNSSYFFGLEKQRQTKKKINKLLINDVNTDNQDQINEEIRHFYDKLYESNFSEEDCQLFLEKIKEYKKTMDENFRQLMEDKLRIEELDIAIGRMSKGKAPGLDGLTVEFYVHFWNDIRVLLYNALLQCISSGHLSPTMKRGIITLVPKPNKDKLLLDNWRPITLLCNDYKLLAHVYSRRLDTGLSKLIDECQSAFVKGRNIHNHTRLILDFVDYREYITTESYVLFLDFFKAFDSIEHSFLLKTLQFLGFGNNFCDIVKMLYTDISSMVSLNPGMTPSFKVLRGIRQGCPISPKLFILATQLLTLLIDYSKEIQGITIFDKEFKISQFADDTSIFLKDKSMVDKTLEIISFFSKASGLSLNIKKCELFPIHTSSDSSIASIRVKSEVKYLGITITKNLIRREDINISKRILDMKKSLSHWLTRDLTIFGRTLLSKAEGISKLIYPCYSLYISSKNLKKANTIIFQFLWRNKTHYIKRSQLVKDYDKGGIRAPEFESMVGTFRINWIKSCLSQPDYMWFHIPRSLFEKMGGLDFVLKCDFDVNRIPVKLSNFHKQMLHFWKMIFTHNFSPHNSTLWNNRVITLNRKSVFKNDWFRKDIMFVTDLMNGNGDLLSYTDFTEKYNLNCSRSDFTKLCKSIPLPLIQLIKNSMMYNNSPSVLPKLMLGLCNLNDKKM